MHRTLLLAAAALLGAVSVGRADCANGARETTAAERAFVMRTLEAIAGAMPAAPAGWTVAETTPIDEARWRHICDDGPNAELTVAYTIRYSRVDGRQEIESESVEKLSASMDDLMPSPEEQALLQEAAAKMQRIIEITTQNGGQPTPESMALAAEVDEIQARLDELDGARADRQRVIEAESRPRDVEAVISVRAYSAEQWIENPEPVMAPGAALAFRSAALGAEAFDRPTTLFLGPWQAQTEGAALHVVPDPAVPPANGRVSRLAVMVTAEPERATALIEAIDLPALSALIE